MGSFLFHPLVVHFPIALLTVYSAMEVVRWKRFTALPFWYGTKSVLVILGSISTFVALQSGEALEEKFEGDITLRRVLEAHSNWGDITAWIYGIIAFLYLVAFLEEHGYRNAFVLFLRGRYQGFSDRLRIFCTFAKAATHSVWMVPFALVGLVAVTITGALGGSMVYGPTADPIIAFVYSLFGF